MAVEDFQNALDVLRRRFSDTTAKPVPEDTNLARATVESWFRTYRPQVIELFGDVDDVGAIDICMQQILSLSLSSKRKSAYKSYINSAIKIFRDELIPDVKVAEWRQLATSGFPNESREIASRLKQLNPELELSYRQVLTDLADQRRITYRGTANELREIFREVLDQLAPDKQVTSQSWFKAKRAPIKDDREKNRPPTRAEKVKYVMSIRNQGSSVSEVAKTAASQVDERLGELFNAVYGRASDASHVSKRRDEINRILKYFHAVLFELLPPVS
jgi:hypothetical protein